MDFDLSEEQRLLKESVDGLLNDSYDFDARKKLVGWVERSDTHHHKTETVRWVSQALNPSYKLDDPASQVLAQSR